MNDNRTSIDDLKQAVRAFVHKRDWERFHNPKDLAESICIEAAELLQLFQWTEPERGERLRNNPSKVLSVSEELADVIIYCLSMANTLDIDVTSAVLIKLKQNKAKYPANLYRGKAHLTVQTKEQTKFRSSDSRAQERD